MLLAVSYKAEERIAYVLIEKSERRAATGARNNPNQNTGEDSNICDIPVILAPNGKLGQNWLQMETKSLETSDFCKQTNE